MHNWLMEKGKCLKMEIDNKGIDNLQSKDLEMMYFFSEIIKNIMCVEKDGKIVEAMEKSENEDNMRAIEMYEDYPESKYYDNYRYSNGRYAPKGRGRRMYMPMMEIDDYNEVRGSAGRNNRMGYDMNNNMDKSPDMHISGMESARRGYEEHKKMNKEDKEGNAKQLERLMSEVENYLMNMKGTMSAEEKNVLINKIDHMNRSLAM